ncbi:MAG: hypothetical protein ACI35R_07880 [Bacillus sp. (in: firmicutes)]
MQMTGIVQNLMPQQTSSVAELLKDGQMLHGKVLKIHGNQTAEISIGQTKLLAIIDAPLTVGERYLFQVQSGGDMTSLKVLPQSSRGQGIKELALQLLRHFSLPETKESTAIARFFLKNEMSLTRENMWQALQWMQETGGLSKGLHVMKVLRDLSLPFSQDAFKAILSFENKVPLNTLFASLSQALLNSEDETAVSVKAVLSQLLLANVDKAAEKVLHKMLSVWLLAQGPLKETMFRLLQETGLFTKQAAPAEVIKQSLQLLDGNKTIIQQPAMRKAVDLLVQMQSTVDLGRNKPVQQSFMQLIASRMLELSGNHAEKPRRSS